MTASKTLALATLFLATTFVHAEWKEFIFPDGNFRVVFPETPQQQKGAGACLRLHWVSSFPLGYRGGS